MPNMRKSIAPALRSVGLLCFATLAQGYTNFDTKCSTPENPTNFVSSPDSRGTLDILWSCAFMIITCTWTIQHLNVVEQREGARSRLARGPQVAAQKYVADHKVDAYYYNSPGGYSWESLG